MTPPTAVLRAINAAVPTELAIGDEMLKKLSDHPTSNLIGLCCGWIINVILNVLFEFILASAEHGHHFS